ncbi:BTB/POZ domain-containing protein At1g03010-like [Punica granatum]|uniref:BTB/POZ domain-containing protein At1g03010-like n=1 Tax=Punica granatum TaxID=22663 RepID=A0A218X112_PUNGR|nr:BTB/POZ domain-containing protein At1g03010-like [Punica granatum]OWM78022.1 hypothetical protein CDL15_Pgr018591 [Punica granatum]
MGVATLGELKPSISGRRTFRPSSSVRHATEWPISDVSSDLTVDVGKSSFALHKFPLVSRSGRIRKLLLETKDSKAAVRINLPDVPGGPEGFELAAKFCYGINLEFTPSNIALLRCVAHFLEMTEELAEKNLESRTELFIKEAVLPSISISISVLHRCETLVPVCEEINLVNRLINAIANNACKEQLTSGLSKLDHGFSVKPKTPEPPETPLDWWGKSLTQLKLDFFQRVLMAVKSRGLNQDMISKILINYAQNSLHGLGVRDPQFGKGSSLDPELMKKQRVIVETIVGLLPTQSRKSAVPIVFLSSLLKAAIGSFSSTSCRSDLERRIGLQLDQAILEDILIPVNNSHGNGHQGPMYDTDSVLRIYSTFLNLDEDDDDDAEDNNHLTDENDMVYDDHIDSLGSPKQSAILKASKLMDSYLAEVALDPNLPPSKFTALAELLPDHARAVNDGLYRAVDIFLKVHPNMKDSERYRLCKTVNCQKLTQEACSHAAQNERLPVQTAVQVLYFEQVRMKNAMSVGPGGGTGVHSSSSQFFFSQFPHRSGSGAGSGAISPRDNYASVRRENRELRLEVTRMRMRLTDLERDHVSMKQELGRPHPANRLLRSFTRKLSKLNTIFRRSSSSARPTPMAVRASSENGFLFQKRRNLSIS